MNQTQTIRAGIADCAQLPIQTLEDGFQWTLCFPQDFLGFAGHFPGHPVLPAFIQILATQCAVQQRTGQAWVLQRVKRAKFMKTVAPNDIVIMTWKEKQTEDGLQGSFTLTVGDAKVASFSALFVLEVREEDLHA